jgi:hypothetical protein
MDIPLPNARQLCASLKELGTIQAQCFGVVEIELCSASSWAMAAFTLAIARRLTNGPCSNSAARTTTINASHLVHRRPFRLTEMCNQNLAADILFQLPPRLFG